jgi:hypothetical protein
VHGTTIIVCMANLSKQGRIKPRKKRKNTHC